MRHLGLVLISMVLIWSCRSGKEPTSGETPSVLSFLIGPEKVDCIGEGPQLCYLIKEDIDGDWTNFYGEIDGFEYEPGYNYEILVEKIKISNPMLDGPAFRYRLMKILQKHKTTGSILHDIWIAQSIEGQALKQISNRPRLELMPTQGNMIGFTSCNDIRSRLKVAALRIAFTEISFTEKFCADTQDIERQFIQALERADRYEVRNLELLLYAGDIEMMRLRKVD